MAKLLGVGPTLSTPPVEQGIYQMSKVQNFELGTKLWYGERCFKYARTGATMTLNDRLAYFYPYQICSGADMGAATVGAQTLSMTLGGSDGVAGNGEVAKDELVGAWATIFKVDGSDWADHITVMIIGNTAGATTAIEFDIDNPLSRAIHASAVIDITPNLYRDVRVDSGLSGRRGFLGKPMCMATTTKPFFWLQTWGPFWASPSLVGEYFVGGQDHYNQVSVAGNGSLFNTNADSSYGEFSQHIGFVITRLANNEQGTPLIMMQISC